MNIYVGDERLDYFIHEDVPYIDLTTEELGISDEHGRIDYYTREDCVLCGTEEAARIFERLGADVVAMLPSGSRLTAGETFLSVTGTAGALHMGWKVGLNLVDRESGVATRTRRIVDAAHDGNPACGVFATRKCQPGARDLLVKAVTTGGALPHRLGLSETILVFSHHIEFMGGFDAFLRQLPSLKTRCAEKKVFAEADAEQAIALARTGVDGIQLDKIPLGILAQLVSEVREIDSRITLIATGGINETNAEQYASTGVDGLATTSPYNAKPIDMSVRMIRLG